MAEHGASLRAPMSVTLELPDERSLNALLDQADIGRALVAAVQASVLARHSMVKTTAESYIEAERPAVAFVQDVLTLRTQEVAERWAALLESDV